MSRIPLPPQLRPGYSESERDAEVDALPRGILSMPGASPITFVKWREQAASMGLPTWHDRIPWLPDHIDINGGSGYVLCLNCEAKETLTECDGDLHKFSKSIVGFVYHHLHGTRAPYFLGPVERDSAGAPSPDIQPGGPDEHS